MQPMMGMNGMQMGMPQQMAQMGQMTMMPQGMAMMPQGMMPAMGMMPMGVQMMPMGMMGMNGMNGMNPMMMMQGQMNAGMMGSQSSGNQEDPASHAPHKAVSSGSGSRRHRRDEDDSDEEGRGRQALRNVGSAAAHSKEAKKSGTSQSEAAAAPPAEAAPEPEKKKRCHLHTKPSNSCKVCRRIKDENAALDASKEPVQDLPDKDEGGRREKDEAQSESAKDFVFRCSPMLKDQILKSSYFKSLMEITTVEALCEEIIEYADNLDVYNSGGASTTPSCFICQVYRLFTLPHAEDELQVIFHSDSAVVRCVGFVFVRFVFEPTQFFQTLEEHLYADMELKYQEPSGKSASMSIGEYVENLMIKEKYFSTPLPRIPVKVRQQLEERLAPLPSYRKRMQANRKAFQQGRVVDTPVEVCVDNGKWVAGKAVEMFGRSSTFVKVRVKLEDGKEITAHLGKVVLRDSGSDASGSEDSGGRSGSEGATRNRRKKQRRSRSRGQGRAGRGRSPDWSRWKGKSHVEMLEELRERAKQDAVCGSGKVYPRRPLTFEGFATKAAHHEIPPAELDGGSGAKPSWVQPRQSAHKQEDADEDDITRRLKARKEDERRREQQAIFEKYGKQSRPGAGAGYSDVDRADVLRLG